MHVLTRRAATGMLALAPFARWREGVALAQEKTPPAARRMRITRYELFPCRVPMAERVREAWQASFFRQGRRQTHYEPTLVKLYTDEGLFGIGDAQLPPARAKAVLDRMVGRTPWEYLLDDSIRGILAAVCDLLGKAAGLPAARLFSPNPKSEIIQTWWSQCYPPALMASEAKLGASLGYKVHKVKARPWEDVVAQAAAIVDAVPADFRVWVDANETWGSVGRTRFFLDKLSRFPNYFAVESPIPREHLDGYKELHGSAPLQVAEHWPVDAMQYLRENALDAIVVGGPPGRSFVQKALAAEVASVPLWVEHSIETGVNQVFQAQQAAAFPSVEYAISVTHVLEDDLMVEPFTMRDGFYAIPKAPGLGVSLDEAAIDKYRV